MADQRMIRRSLAGVLVLTAGLALAACGGDEAEPTYEAGVTDASGGELIVTDPSETGVPVKLPETPMTPVPPEQGASPSPSATPSATAAE